MQKTDTNVTTRRAKVLCRSYSHFHTVSAETRKPTDAQEVARIRELGETLKPVFNSMFERKRSGIENRTPKTTPDSANQNSLLVIGETDRSRKLQLEMTALRHTRSTTARRTLKMLLEESERTLQGVKAGKRFDVTRKRLGIHSEGNYNSIDLSKMLPEFRKESLSTSPGKSGKRNGPRLPPPLVLNRDKTNLDMDAFYAFLVAKSPRAAAVYRGAGKSLQQAKSIKKTRYKRIDEPTMREEGADGNLKMEGTHGSKTTRERHIASSQKNTTESLRENCIKFDKLKLKLDGLLTECLDEREVSRSLTCRSKLEAAERSFQYRDSSRDLNEMRKGAVKNQQKKLQERRYQFKQVQRLVSEVRGDSDRNLSAKERSLLQSIVGYLRSPSGFEFGPKEFVELLSQCEHSILEDSNNLRLIEGIKSEILGINETEFRTYLYASGKDLPRVLYHIEKSVADINSACFVGGARAAALASRLMRHRSELHDQKGE